MNSKETHSESSQLLQELAGYSTLHGFHVVATSSYATIRRLIWLALMLASMTFLIFQLTSSLQKLNSNRHVVDINIIHSREVIFPAFTFCNVNMMKKWKIQGTQSQLYQDMLDPYKSVGNKTLNSSFNLEKAVLDSGHTAQDMVSKCTWKKKDCSYRNLTTFYSNRYGLCHTFNPGSQNQSLLTSTSTSKEKGLMLRINVKTSNYYGRSMYSGIVFTLHNQNESPLIEEHGTLLSPGFMTFIKIKRKKFKLLPPPYASACGSRKLVTSSVYSRNTCLLECYARDIAKKCECRQLGMPVLPGSNVTKFCWPDDMERCKQKTSASENHVDHSTDHEIPDPNVCDCPNSCEETKFAFELNKAYFPSTTYFERYNHQKDMFMDYFRQNIMAVDAYYGDLRTDEITQRPAYDITDFVSDFGGNLGLFLGCSIITVVEFLDFLIIFCITKYKSRKQTTKRSESVDEKAGRSANYDLPNLSNV